MLSPALALLVAWLPLPLDFKSHRLAAIFVAVLVAWVTEAVPLAVTALLIGPLCVVTGVADPKAAFMPYADPVLFVFVGGFFIARAMTVHGLDRRMADALVFSAWVSGSPARIRTALIAAAVLISMWVSNTATAAILLPIATGILDSENADSEHSNKTRAGTYLVLAYACTIGGLGTLVGTPPNLITARFLETVNVNIGFLEWLPVGLSAALIISLALYLLMEWLFPIRNVAATSVVQKPTTPWSSAERWVAASFGLAVFGWVLPGFLQIIASPWATALEELLDPGAVALIAAFVLFIAPNKSGNSAVLSWNQATQIDWGTILLFGGGICLGEQMFQTGLVSTVSRSFLETTGVESMWALSAIAATVTLILSELCSNVAAANMMLPLVIGIAQELHVSPIPPALATGIAASGGFMLPVATGPNAIAYATHKIPMRAMLRAGILLDVIYLLLLLGILYLLCPLLGWT